MTPDDSERVVGKPEAIPNGLMGAWHLLNAQTLQLVPNGFAPLRDTESETRDPQMCKSLKRE
jgi:hypothetical protein